MSVLNRSLKSCNIAVSKYAQSCCNCSNPVNQKSKAKIQLLLLTDMSWYIHSFRIKGRKRVFPSMVRMGVPTISCLSMPRNWRPLPSNGSRSNDLLSVFEDSTVSLRIRRVLASRGPMRRPILEEETRKLELKSRKLPTLV
jgi:hypothetical protein